MDRRPNVVGVPVEETRAPQPSQPARESGEETPPREYGHEDAGHTEGVGYTESGKQDDRLDRVRE
jgi:hypothetical protein